MKNSSVDYDKAAWITKWSNIVEIKSAWMAQAVCREQTQYGWSTVQPGHYEDQSPPFKSAQFHKNYVKKIKYQKPNLKTLNSSVILPWAANL